MLVKKTSTKLIYSHTSKKEISVDGVTISGKLEPIDVVIPERVKLKGRNKVIVRVSDFFSIKTDYNSYKSKDYLRSIILPNTVRNIGGWCFKYFKKLEKIVFSENLEEIPHDAFQECYSLDNITIPSSVLRIGERAFNGCTSLKSIKINEGVKEIGYAAFCLCTELETIRIPKSVVEIGSDAFKCCENLKEVIIEGSWKNMEFFGHDAFPATTKVTYLNK